MARQSHTPETLGKMLHVFTRMYHSHMRYAFDRHGLQEVGNPALLFMLYRENRPVTQVQIANRLGTSPPTVATSVKRMEKTGLVQKVSDESDLRKNHITLTQKGAQLAEDCIQVQKECYSQITGDFSQEEIDAFCYLLHRMIDNMKESGGRPPDDFTHLPCNHTEEGTTQP